MLHLAPALESQEPPQPYAEAVARLASIRHALRLVDGHGGGPADDCDVAGFATAWSDGGAARRRQFDDRSGRVIAATVAGLDALLAVRESGRSANPAAVEVLADDIRLGLEDLSRLMLA